MTVILSTSVCLKRVGCRCTGEGNVILMDHLGTDAGLSILNFDYHPVGITLQFSNFRGSIFVLLFIFFAMVEKNVMCESSKKKYI